MNIRGCLLIISAVLCCCNVWAEDPAAADSSDQERPGLATCAKSVRKADRKSLGTDECKLAVAFYEQEIAKDPNSAENYLLVGRCYGFMGKFEEAIKYDDKAMALDPKDWTPHMDKAMNYVALKRFQEARPEFRRALQILNEQGGKLKDIEMVQELMRQYDR